MNFQLRNVFAKVDNMKVHEIATMVYYVRKKNQLNESSLENGFKEPHFLEIYKSYIIKNIIGLLFVTHSHYYSIKCSCLTA